MKYRNLNQQTNNIRLISKIAYSIIYIHIFFGDLFSCLFAILFFLFDFIYKLSAFHFSSFDFCLSKSLKTPSYLR